MGPPKLALITESPHFNAAHKHSPTHNVSREEHNVGGASTRAQFRRNTARRNTVQAEPRRKINGVDDSCRGFSRAPVRALKLHTGFKNNVAGTALDGGRKRATVSTDGRERASSYAGERLCGSVAGVATGTRSAELARAHLLRERGTPGLARDPCGRGGGHTGGLDGGGGRHGDTTAKNKRIRLR